MKFVQWSLVIAIMILPSTIFASPGRPDVESAGFASDSPNHWANRADSPGHDRSAPLAPDTPARSGSDRSL